MGATVAQAGPHSGLYGKYVVTHPGSDVPLQDVFVLRPTKDPAAAAALAAYAAATDDLLLRSDLYDWLGDIARAEASGGTADFPIPVQAQEELAALPQLPDGPPGGAQLLQCRSCSAVVFFARMVRADGKDGAKSPINWPPVPAGGHLELLLEPDGSPSMVAGNPRMRVIGKERAAELRAQGTILYTGHFGTCPDADRWRDRG